MKFSKEVTKAVIATGGWGTRMFPVSKTLPKAMVPVLNYPSIHYVVEECMNSGITDIMIVGSHHMDIIKEYFTLSEDLISYLEKTNKTSRLATLQKIIETVNISYAEQTSDYPYGNGTPLLVAKDFIGDDNFAYLFIDILMFSDNPVIGQLVDMFKSTDCEGVICGVEVPKEDIIGKLSCIRFSEDNKLQEIFEKPTEEQLFSNLSARGRYVFSSAIFDYLNPDILGKNNELWLVDSIAALQKTFTVMVKKVDGVCVGTGDPKSTLDAVIYLVSRDENLWEYMFKSIEKYKNEK